ncbi:putative tyrosyl-DNA phosphodiesterase [Operophtera brumata]|uniref:Putative tyrosyl-DNA phosphodiesterase n=1 Tax=Operophtera brumata TaxID=104452 RepID=A0A0L7LDY6_OPEBR|nr:putative tyrosyl-DNA phosphodiesterase [Operophtera brumata]
MLYRAVEMLDRAVEILNLGELKCSLQINFMVELGWLLAQYYFAGYSEKKLTILYGEDSPDLRTITQKKPHVDAHRVAMPTPFGTHHTLLRQHCRVPAADTRRWPLLAQASSIGSYGAQPKALAAAGAGLQHRQLRRTAQGTRTLTLSRAGSLLRQHCRVPAADTRCWPLLLVCLPPLLTLQYVSENVRQSHDGLLGGGCLPYGAAVHTKQPWLNDFLYQWRATSTCRNRAMPHIKSYTRTSPDHKMAAFYLLTSANASKAAWGSVNKGDAKLRLMSYEAGVLLLPTFVVSSYKIAWGSVNKGDAKLRLMTYEAGVLLLPTFIVSRYKIAWGSVNKGGAKLRLMSYEAGVLLLPSFVINKDYFPLDGATDRLVLAYDVPPTKYTADMSPWVMDYLS